MSTVGQFSSKNPTIKRILKEAAELATQPSSEYYAAPLESDLFEWHFTIRGPPSPSPYDGGIYHGRIILPPAYPLKPPSFRFMTPTGRFEVNREICLSISGHHEETWQPAWGIRTALVAIRSFMDTSASGQLGGMDANEEARKRMAVQSPGFKCPSCGKTNDEIMHMQADLVKEQDMPAQPEIVPEELRLAYREDLAQSSKTADAKSANVPTSSPASQVPLQVNSPPSYAPQRRADGSQVPDIQPPLAVPAPTQTAPPAIREAEIPAWIDKAIYGVLAALLFLLWRRFV